MGSSDVHVVVTLDFDDEWLEQVVAVDPRLRVTKHLADSPDDIPGHVLATAQVLYTNTAFPTAAQAPVLRWVQLDTSGIDHVRGTELWDTTIPITTIGGISPRPLAGWVLSWILADAYHHREVERLDRDSTWPTWEHRWNRLMPRQLTGATVGVIGFGRIGREVGRLATAFGMQVIGLQRRGSPTNRGPDPDGSAEIVAGPDGLVELLGRSDYVVLTVPYTPDTHHLLDEAAFDNFKRGAVLINAARGGVVDEEALIRALDTGRLEVAVLDVFATEPLPANSPFWRHDRVRVSPHVAGFAPDYRDRVGELFRENLRRLLADEPLINVADRDQGY